MIILLINKVSPFISVLLFADLISSFDKPFEINATRLELKPIFIELLLLMKNLCNKIKEIYFVDKD